MLSGKCVCYTLLGPGSKSCDIWWANLYFGAVSLAKLLVLRNKFFQTFLIIEIILDHT